LDGNLNFENIIRELQMEGGGIDALMVSVGCGLDFEKSN
jgi:hypothetical protein